jgi:hypothetical protein
MDDYNWNNQTGTKVIAYHKMPIGSNDNQLWTYDPTLRQITNLYTQMCLQANTFYQNTRLVQQPCVAGKVTQQFSFLKTRLIVLQDYELCVSLPTNVVDGDQLILQPCQFSPTTVITQKWSGIALSPVPEAARVINQAPGKFCMTQSTTKVVSLPCQAAGFYPLQAFFHNRNDQLVNRQTGQCVAVTGTATPKFGDKLVMKACTAGTDARQTFHYTKTTLVLTSNVYLCIAAAPTSYVQLTLDYCDSTVVAQQFRGLTL